MYRVIHLHLDAPPKPASGDPCNGCGVCCATEPCPIGILVSRRLDGHCAALQWTPVDGDGDGDGTDGQEARDRATSRYRCGLVSQARAHLPAPMRRFAPLVERMARRMIAAGRGCDCSSVADDSLV